MKRTLLTTAATAMAASLVAATLPATAAPVVPQVLAKGTVTGALWDDTNVDGIRQAGEPALGCTIMVSPVAAPGQVVLTVDTRGVPGGRYSMQLDQGSYKLSLMCDRVSGNRTLLSPADIGTNDAVDSDDSSRAIAVTSGQTRSVDIGIVTDGHGNAATTFGDKTGDRRADIVTSDANGNIEMWTWPKTGGLRVSSSMWMTNVKHQVVQVPHMGGDAKSDTLLASTDGVLWLVPSSRVHGIPDIDQVRPIASGWSGMNEVTYARNLAGTSAQHLVARRKTDGTLWRYTFSGASLVGMTQIGKSWNGMRMIASVGDFTGDGRSDIIAVRADSTLWVYAGTAKGTVGEGRMIGNYWSSMIDMTSPGDLDGDGRQDLLARSATGELWIYPNVSPLHFGPAIRVGEGFQHYHGIG